MESQQKHVIHLYQFEQQSINEKQLSAQILESLKPYIGDKNPQIKIKGHRHKYWAYFQIQPQIAKKLNAMKTIKVGQNLVHIGRYYYDYQIFINKLDSNITREQVIQYFQQFGQVVDIVITDPVEKKKEGFHHCYIKMKDQKTIDMIVLAKLHKLQGKQIKPVRTFGLNQYKQSDKKLFLKIQGFPDNLDQFQQYAIQFFMKHGKMRERPKIEQTNNNQKYKMIITYTNAKDAQNARLAFQNSSFLNDYQKKNVVLTLTYFHTKQNKIYVGGLKENTVQNIQEAFSHFGQISQITVSKGKFNTLTAVIGYGNQNDFKMALGTALQIPKITALFVGKPYITIFMNAEEKKQYHENRKKQFLPAKTNTYIPGGMMVPPFQGGMNPGFRMPIPGVHPNQIPPNMPPMGMGGMPPAPMLGQFGPPPQMNQMGGQFNQPPNRGFPKQMHPQPRNN